MSFASERLRHAETMLAKYDDLLERAAGTRTVTVDGIQVSYDDLEKRHAYWARMAARLKGLRPTAAQIDLRNV